MDPEQFQQLPAAPYPAPPPFWKHFTEANVERIKEDEPGAELPLDLNFLRPPPPPAPDADSYTTFSTEWKLDPTPALPPPEILLFDPTSSTFNHARALKQLTNSLLLNFLEMIGVLSNDPVKYQAKLEDIERLMLNVHFVINLYRPHQAREGVKEMLQNQLEDGRREIEQCDSMKQKVEAFLKEIELWKTKPETNGHKDATQPDHEESRKLWDLIHRLKDNQ